MLKYVKMLFLDHFYALQVSLHCCIIAFSVNAGHILLIEAGVGTIQETAKAKQNFDESHFIILPPPLRPPFGETAVKLLLASRVVC